MTGRRGLPRAWEAVENRFPRSGRLAGYTPYIMYRALKYRLRVAFPEENKKTEAGIL